MSLSINKLFEVLKATGPRQNSNDKLTKSITPAVVPERAGNITKSEYYTSVKRAIASSHAGLENVVMDGTPNGSKAMPTRSGALENPQGFAIDGSIDPENIRKKRDPLHALPYDYTEGAEGLMYGLPKSTVTAENYVSLIQKARNSYYARMTMYEPHQTPAPQPNMGPATQAGMDLPPAYEDIINQMTSGPNKTIANDAIYA